MDKGQLKKYIKCIYELEKSIHMQKKLLSQIENKIHTLKNYNGNYLHKLPNDPRSAYHYDFGPLWFGCLVGLIVGTILCLILLTFQPGWSILYYVVSIYNLVIGKLDVFWNEGNQLPILITFLVPLGGIILGALIGHITETHSLRKHRNERKKEIDNVKAKNSQIQSKNSSQKAYNQKVINLLLVEKNKIQNEYNNTLNLLNKYYNYNIIFSKYRNFIAISSICEYFEAGRTSTLEGHEGAYNIFENEIRLNHIITKLDDVIYHLNEIRDNQHMLYMAINSNNNDINRLTSAMYSATNKLESLNNNAQITAHHSKIAAENSQFQKYLSIFNSLR